MTLRNALSCILLHVDNGLLMDFQPDDDHYEEGAKKLLKIPF
jgi:hypothetical protein